MILEKYKGEYQRQYFSLRSFPEGNRNCYKIKDVSAGTKYFIRAGFLYGDYDRQDMPPSLDLYIGSDLWDTINISDSKIYVDKEIIHIPPQNHMLVCLANTDHGIPFISTLELRPLDNAAYQTQRAGSLALAGRWDVGSSRGYGYTVDFYNRFWYKWQPQNFKTLSTTLPIIDSEGIDAHYNIPSVVMSTAAAPVANGSLIFWWPPRNISTPGDQYYFYMHFAEIQLLQANETREFNIFYNGRLFGGPISPPYLRTRTVYNKNPFTGPYQHNFTIYEPENSTLPPILNALEIYSFKQFSLQETDQQDGF